jgi:hypothetical protein
MLKACSCALVLCLLVSPAGAVCMIPRPRLACAEFFKEQVVVIARMAGARHVVLKKDDAIDYHIYTMQTDRVLRGNIGSTFRIYEENSSGRAGFDWKIGESYLLFLSYFKEDHGWQLDGCGNSGPLRQSENVLSEIEKIEAATDGGAITGEVRFHPGVMVIAQGTGGTFRTRADKEGQFRLQVPAGVYSVRAMHRGQHFVAEDLSYELPRRLRIENGGCAQIAFVRVEPGEPQPPSERLPGR